MRCPRVYSATAVVRGALEVVGSGHAFPAPLKLSVPERGLPPMFLASDLLPALCFGREGIKVTIGLGTEGGGRIRVVLSSGSRIKEARRWSELGVRSQGVVGDA
jgi:hypothetical protein